MAGGTVTVVPASYGALTEVAQRVLCWAAADASKIRIDTQGPRPAVVIPEAVISGKGTLVLKRGGADLVSGYVAGSNIVQVVSNAAPAVGQPYPACATSAAQPNATVTAFNVGGNALAITVTVDNLTAGTVTINWGDGTSTAGVAQTGTANHTYAGAGYRTITVIDESDTTQRGSISVNLPYNV